MSSQQVVQALQRPPLATVTEPTRVTTGRIANWQMIEETEEEVVLDLEGRVLNPPSIEGNLMSPPNVLGSTGVFGPLIPRASTQMTVGDWSQGRVTWGKKHKGKTYHIRS